jgi:hypothetical protein
MHNNDAKPLSSQNNGKSRKEKKRKERKKDSNQQEQTEYSALVCQAKKKRWATSIGYTMGE